MNNPLSTQTRKALTAAAAVALALGLAACEQEGPAEKMGRKIDETAEQATQKADKAVDSAGDKIDKAKSAIAEKTEKAGATLADAAITAKVKAAIAAEPGLQPMGIDVVTEKGVVSLHGTTNSAANRQRATQLASAVEGVASVDNRLVILKGS